jgi:hypothetical protein
MLETVKRVTNWPVQFGGHQHTGWLPAGAAIPLPTSVVDVSLDIEIQSDGDGYLLCYSSKDGTVHGDTWHRSVVEAVNAATMDFGVPPTHWQPDQVQNVQLDR